MGITGPGKSGMSRFHPPPRFAAVILNGACRQYSGHQAGFAGAAQPDPDLPLMLSGGADPENIG